MNLILSSMFLGLAGIDPLALMLLVVARASGMSRRGVVLFAVSVLLFTTLIGVSSDFLFSGLVKTVSIMLSRISDEVYLFSQILIALILGYWALKRILTAKSSREESNKENGFTKFLKYGAIFSGIIFSFSALSDPSFLALIALSSNKHILISAGSFIVWTLVSQAPLFAFAISVIFKVDDKFISWVEDFRRRNSRRISIILTILIFSAGVILLIDSMWFLLFSKWLI